MTAFSFRRAATGSGLVSSTSPTSWCGQLVMNGRKVLLSNIRCPLLNVVASNDVIAPRPTTSAIRTGQQHDKAELVVKAGHVGIVCGRRTDLAEGRCSPPVTPNDCPNCSLPLPLRLVRVWGIDRSQ